MASLNQCNFIGRCGSDPAVRYTQDGKAVANMSIAVTEKWKDNERTEWVKLIFWDKLAGIVEKYIKKGSLIFVSGRLQSREYEKDGQKRYMTEVVVSTMQMLDSKGSGNSQEQGNDQVQGTPDTGSDDSIPF